MDASRLKILSAIVHGFRTNVGELTHWFVLKNNVYVVVMWRPFWTTGASLPATGFSSSYTGSGATAKEDKAMLLLCHCSSLQIDALPINVQEAMELLLLRITLEGGGAFFLCAAYRPQ